MEENFNENHIRDYLASNLSTLEEGLVFLEKESYLPSSLCTRSFIDLLAKDKNKKLVLIEVKKTVSASRETIHEILKYIEAAKNHFGMRENEIRVIVASMNWTELLVPFSAFLDRTSCEVTGFKLRVNKSGEVVGAEYVEPVPIQSERVFSPYYEFLFFERHDRLQSTIARVSRAYNIKGICSFVVVVLKCSKGNKAGLVSQRQITMRKVITEIGDLSGIISNNTSNTRLPRYKRVLCFAMQQLSIAEYLKCFPNNESRSDAESSIEPDNEEESLWTLHDSLMALEPSNHSDFKDIGNPVKLRALLEEEGWELDKVIRYGSFDRNNLLTDEAIVSELCGSTGRNRQMLEMTFDPSIRSEVAELRRRVDDCLGDNPAWRTHIHAVLSAIVSSRENRACYIHVYNPNSALTTMYMAATQDDGAQYIPSFHIDVPKTDIETMYFGSMTQEGFGNLSLQKILDDFYEGRLETLLFTLNWGGYETRDSEIMRRIGLRYKTFQVQVDGESRRFSQFDEGLWTPCESHFYVEDYFIFLSKNMDLVQDICKTYSSHWDGRIVYF